jgi:hypothetical protein
MNDLVERVNRRLKEPIIERYHYDSHDQLCGHLAPFLDAYNDARRPKILTGLIPYEFVCRPWSAEPCRFTANPRTIECRDQTTQAACWACWRQYVQRRPPDDTPRSVQRALRVLVRPAFAAHAWTGHFAT